MDPAWPVEDRAGVAVGPPSFVLGVDGRIRGPDLYAHDRRRRMTLDGAE
jgi:hypothetical protein